MGKERNLYIDVLKAINIILVILGHCIQYGTGGNYGEYYSFFYHPVFIFIYSFHMPMFILISGYLFAYSCKDRAWHTVLISKSKQLLIPLAGWSIITTIIQIIKIACGVSTHKFGFIWIFQSILSGFWGGPWFLWAVWWSILAVTAVKHLFKDHPVAYLIICLVTLVIPDDVWPATYKFMLPFFILAYYFNAHALNVKCRKIYLHPAFISGCCIAFVLLLHLYNYDTFIYTSGYYIFKYPSYALMQIHNNALRFIIGLFGSVSIMYLTYGLVKILPNAINRALAYLGTKTLGVYVISNYIFDEILQRLPIPSFNYLYILIEAVSIIAVCVLLTALIQKNKYTNRILLGGR